MQFVVFSYNRGVFLENCIASIERCAPGHKVAIFDDNSDDADTQRILGALAERHTVWLPEVAGAGKSKHGGLYSNMQSALERLDENTLMCFLQDDVQLVRGISEKEVTRFAHYFDAVETAGFIQPAFFKGSNRHSDLALTRFDPELGGYRVDRFRHSAGASYSDILISRVRNLRNAGWTFLQREAKNELQARAKFRQMLYLRNPFVAWLPCTPAYRGKVRTWALRRAHRLSGAGFYPLRYMNAAEEEAFVNRDAHVLPVAEDFLEVSGAELPKPWIYHPLQGRRMLKSLNSAELRIRRLFE